VFVLLSVVVQQQQQQVPAAMTADHRLQDLHTSAMHVPPACNEVTNVKALPYMRKQHPILQQ
jgi:hypothetical protein